MVVYIYIFIQLREHYVRALSANVIKSGNFKFQFSAWETSLEGGERREEERIVNLDEAFAQQLACKSQVTYQSCCLEKLSQEAGGREVSREQKDENQTEAQAYTIHQSGDI